MQISIWVPVFSALGFYLLSLNLIGYRRMLKLGRWLDLTVTAILILIGALSHTASGAFSGLIAGCIYSFLTLLTRMTAPRTPHIRPE